MTKTRKKSVGSTAARQPRKGTRKPAAPRTQEQATPPIAPAEPSAADISPPGTPARQTKKGSILSLLQRPDGVAISELTAATGWQVHSVRAALTGLRKEGKELLRDKD
jgi:hypothetical protein